MTVEQNAGLRGAPLLFLVAVVGGWIAARTATFAPLWTDGSSTTVHRVLQRSASLARRTLAEGRPMPAVAVGADVGWSAVHVRRRQPVDPVHPHMTSISPISSGNAAPVPLSSLPPPSIGGAASTAPSNAVLYPAGPAESGLMLSPPPAESGARWSADGWLLLREDSGRSAAAGRPSYGRSQAGAVLRYSLAPGSAHAPQAHLRATAALAGDSERDLAAGVSARLGRSVPLRVTAEVRVSEAAGRTAVRPAAYAVTELPPLKLPLGARGEVYLQGGYVGGRFATALVDGQARVEHPLVRFGESELSLGGGSWGGAQKGSARLDVGPTAALSFRLGAVRARIAADYRLRVAGQAAPSSGPALTVSAGF